MPAKAAHCKIHPETELIVICPSCVAAGGKGVTSPRKAKASARNGRLGGRPKLPKHAPDCDVDVTGRYTKGCPRCAHEAQS